jgi:DNA-binding response OmpR family regulator
MARVLVIDGEEWVAKMLAGAMREQKYQVKTCATAQAGVAAARGVAFDCIVCDVTLPDHDGFWVARQVRGLRGTAALTPFLFLSKVDHPRARLQGFQMGADVFVTKPFRLDELMPQLAALVQMGARLREVRARFSSRPPAAPESPAMAGELSQASIPTLLTVLEMEGRTGTFEVAAGDRQLQIQIADGSVVSGDIDGAPTPPLSTLRAMLSLGNGRFSFTGAPSDAVTQVEGRQAIGTLLMNALHVEDKDQPVATPTPLLPPPPAPPLPPPQPQLQLQPQPQPQPQPPSIAPDSVEVEPVEVEPDLDSYRPPG